ncbi:Ribosomal protein S6 kinase beta [Taenia crassiceps]|uniref:Ribosomal protein S6 kinase beta n=1 Tax=Taenia crassiceps TaxID=6207 RepID=A0ABR4Q1S9_9CEST
MVPERFTVMRFISHGTYSVVYEIAYSERGGRVSTSRWALKRIYLQNESAVRCALREHNVLVKLARSEHQSPFLCTLLRSFLLRGGPAFVLRKGSDINLRDLIKCVGFLREEAARFYSCEVICGLEHLHAMRIVHLDIKPSNVLLDDSGHVFITDFDRAYDMAPEKGPPRWTDFTGTPFFMAPEVRDRIEITTRADVWSLGLLIASMLYKRSTISDWLRTGPSWREVLPNASIPLRSLFDSCLKCNYGRRVDICGVKRLRFYKDIKWEEVMTCNMAPPYYPSQLSNFVVRDVSKLNPYDSLLLAAAHHKCKPLIDKRLQDFYDRNGVRRLKEVSTNRRGMLRAGLTAKRMNELFANFEFTNPHLL